MQFLHLSSFFYELQDRPVRFEFAAHESEAIVPHDDMENRWKNRRVEFVLVD